MSWNRDHLTPVERMLFRSDRIKVGRFECPNTHPSFGRTGPLDNDVFVFVRGPVWLRRGHGPFRFLTAGDIVLHRAGSELERRNLAEHGDDALWFGVHPALFLEALERHRLPLNAMGGALISDLPTRQRLNRMVHRLERSEGNRLEVEQTALELLSDICRRRSGSTPAGRGPTHRRRSQIVDRTRAFLDQHLGDEIGLDQVAREAGASLYHLCRIFRELTGLSLHQYRIRQRIARAMDRVTADPDVALTDLALELGFSSHSHLTREFTRQLGMAPSAYRSAA